MSALFHTLYLSANKAKIREANAFREVWEFDYQPARCSPERMSQRWVWVNEILFRKNERRSVEMQTMIKIQTEDGPERLLMENAKALVRPNCVSRLRFCERGEEAHAIQSNGCHLSTDYIRMFLAHCDLETISRGRIGVTEEE
jgi:hypothetical protein